MAGMMDSVAVPLDDIYVPVRHKKTLDAAKVESLAEDILENGMRVPIHVRLGNQRYVLVEGFHRLEAMRALGEATIEALIVRARKA